MNIGLGASFIALVAGVIYFTAKPAPADVYALPTADAYAKLAHATVSGGQNGVFHLGAPAISGNGSDKIEWIGHAYTCTLGLSAVDAKSTKVAISCGKPGDDAPDSFLTGQLSPHNSSG